MADIVDGALLRSRSDRDDGRCGFATMKDARNDQRQWANSRVN
jgi:hypothetical protein